MENIIVALITGGITLFGVLTERTYKRGKRA